MLGQAGVDYVLAEADTVCSGITKNTTAKITSQHGLIYHKLIRQFGTEKAALYLHSNQAALEKYVSDFRIRLSSIHSNSYAQSPGI